MQSWMIGLVWGVVFSGFWPVLPPWPLSLVFAGITLGAVRWRCVALLFVSGLACGCAVGVVYGTLLLQSRLADACVGLPLTVTGTVSSLPSTAGIRGAGLRQRFEFSVSAMSPPRCSGPAKLLLSYYGNHRIQPGAEWQFEVKLRKPWGLANPGSYNMQAWFAQRGIDAVGSIRETGRTRRLHPEGAMLAMPDRLRQRISKHIGTAHFAPEVAGILRAVTVADSNGIGPRLWLLFQQFGVNHLLVISGLHVGMVASVAYIFGSLFLRFIPVRRFGGLWIPGVFALLLSCLYGALAGFSLPVQRALCMLACFVIVGLSGRKCGSARIFLLAATTVLLANPLAAVGSGFWLSFGAVAALLWFARWQHGLSAFRGLLQTQGFMSLIMLPLGASFFGGGSLVAMPANLLMIPLIGWIVVPTGLLAVVSFLCGWPMELALWHISAWPLEKLLPLATALAVEGRNWLYLPLTANPGEVLLAVLGIALLALPTRAGSKLLAVIVTMPMLLPLATPPATPSLNTEITVLDVGQGAAVVVRSGHRALVYDTGGGDPEGVNMGSMVVLPYLRYRGISSLDTLVISHPDLDHSAGTAVVRNALAVERFRYGGERPVVGGGRPCIAGESWRWPGGQVFQFLSPAEEILPRSNDSSCVLLVQVGDYRLLLTGDIEAERERALVLYWDAQLRSDWLLAAHHGSNTSSSLTFLKQVQPKVVVISSGYANRFGHPHPLTIRRLTDLQPTIYSTATGGALTFSLTPGQVLQVDAHRRTVRRYWM